MRLDMSCMRSITDRLTIFFQYIQQDFVRDRQQNQTITSDDLIRRMTVAKCVLLLLLTVDCWHTDTVAVRLYALSMHEKELTVEVWDRRRRKV